MPISKPERGAGKKEAVKLDAAAAHLLEECRMVLPGIQALFGFQLIAVFNQGFEEKLSSGEQLLHLAAIVMVASAIALVMGPAAVHRQTSQREVSERFIWVSSVLVLAGMYPLAFGLCIDIYLVSRVILGVREASLAVAACVLAVFFALWIALPRYERSKEE